MADSLTEELFLKHILALSLLAQLALAQFRPVEPRQTHERVLAIVPVVGTGHPSDHKRPLFADIPNLIGYHAELSDDGLFALVEYVARTRADLAPISAVRDARVQTFSKTDKRRDDIVREFQKLKRNFNIDNFGLSVR